MRPEWPIVWMCVPSVTLHSFKLRTTCTYSPCLYDNTMRRTSTPAAVSRIDRVFRKNSEKCKRVGEGVKIMQVQPYDHRIPPANTEFLYPSLWSLKRAVALVFSCRAVAKCSKSSLEFGKISTKIGYTDGSLAFIPIGSIRSAVLTITTNGQIELPYYNIYCCCRSVAR